MHARPDVAAALLGGVEQLGADVVDRQQQRAGHVVGAGEVREVVLAQPPAADVEDRAHRQQRVRRVTAEDVRAAGAVAEQQPAAVGDAALQLGGVARVVGDDRRAALLLPPPERGHVLVVAVQDPGLAGAGLRGPVGLPAHEVVAAVGDPALQRRRVAVAQRALQDVVGEAVDLQQQQARDLGALALPARAAARGARRSARRRRSTGRVASDRRDQRRADRHDDPGPDVVDVHAGRDRRGQQQHARVEDERRSRRASGPSAAARSARPPARPRRSAAPAIDRQDHGVAERLDAVARDRSARARAAPPRRSAASRACVVRGRRA